MTVAPMAGQLIEGLRKHLDDLRAERSKAAAAKETLEQQMAALDHNIQAVVEVLEANNGSSPIHLNANRIPLDQFDTTTNEAAPSGIIFPNGQNAKVGQWRKLLIEVAQYLAREGKLSQLELPLKIPGGTRYLLSKEKVHANRRGFFNPMGLGGGIWLETHASAQNIVTQTKLLVSRCGESASSYLVEK